MRKLGLLVVLVAVAVMFAVPAFAADSCGTCSKPCPKPCPKACVTCTRPCNPLQATADNISCMKGPECQKCTFVNPITRVAETICPGPGKDKNKLKCWYCCDAKPCPKPCPKPCAPACSNCGKAHAAAPVAEATK